MNITHSSSTSIMGHCPTLDHYLKDSSHVTSFHGNLHNIHHKNFYHSHDGGHYKAPKVHGKKRVSFATQASTGHELGKKHGGQSDGSHRPVSRDRNRRKDNGLFNINEKETMQHLNQRLSTYLEKVRFLEQENEELERKISEWYEDNAPSTLPDTSQYFRTIRELQNQVSSSTMENAQITINISSAKLAADDLKNKYEMERNFRSGVEADIALLRRALEELNRLSRGVEIEVQCLQEEILQLKNMHEEDVNYLQSQLGSRVNVALNAAPSVDLNQALSKMREQYENLMERNLTEVENIFLEMSAELDREMSSGAEQIVSSKNETVDLRHSVQTLEIELQSQLSLKSALESSLTEVENTYGSHLAQIQALINNLEMQMSQIRSDLERQKSNYKQLMDQKTLLEMEITTYKQLLDGHDIKISHPHVSWNKNVSYCDLRC